MVELKVGEHYLYFHFMTNDPIILKVDQQQFDPIYKKKEYHICSITPFGLIPNGYISEDSMFMHLTHIPSEAVPLFLAVFA